MHMKRLIRTTMFVLLAVLLLALPALAQSGGGYDLTWNTVNGGGGASAGSGYTLNGTLGQPAAGTLSGDRYVLVGGFWAGVSPPYYIYLPLVMRGA